jgi:hypothetical protein
VQAPPDLFFELRNTVVADMYSALFVKFLESKPFAELRCLAPQLLRAWRAKFASASVRTRRVVLNTSKPVSSGLSSPTSAEYGDFVVLTSDMLPRQPLPMFRPHGRVAAQLSTLAGPASAQGTVGETRGEFAPNAESDSFFLRTLCNDVAVDRGAVMLSAASPVPFPLLVISRTSRYFLCFRCTARCS